MARAPKKKRSFHQELVLNRWMLGFFHGGSLDALKERLGADRHEGLEDDGQTKFFHELTRNLFNLDRIDEAQLRRYDLNIVKHWQAITHRRNAVDGHVLTMKYFQYLSLLFTEIYLDWYFNRRQDLLDGLNGQMAEYRKEDGAEPFRDYTADDLNKLAFWNATGSGKTLLLHVNIHQYLHYFQDRNGRSYPDKIILLTPNEGLSRQHLEELALSGFSFTRLFDKNRSPDFPGTIEVIDINKLGDGMGDKTVAVEAFEGNNLVLVDEGHRGAGSAGGAWMARREALVSNGFAFEYSATFGQAVNKGLTIEKAEEELKKAKAKQLDPDRTWREWTQAERDTIILDSRQKRRAKVDAVTFKDYLREEGITPSDEMLELDFPTKPNLPAGKRLKTLKLKDGYKDNQAKGFKRTHYPTLYDLGDFEDRVKKPHITLDLYPRVEALATKQAAEGSQPAKVRNEGKICPAAMAGFDWDALFLAVQEYKLLRTWSNLRLDRERLKLFCSSRQDWYTLYAPASELEVRSFADIEKQQGIMIRLLIDYTDRFYQALKGAYEGQFFQVDYVDEDHGSMLEAYRFEIDNTDEGETWLSRLKELQAVVAAGDIDAARKWGDGPLIAISFREHLYYPLMSPAEGHTLPLRMRPIAFDAPSEVQFVRDLKAFCASDSGKAILAGKSLYLLRNADTKAKGLGFATAGNFYPDFLLWLVDEESGKQWLSFVDPKGIRNLDLADPKLQLYREIKGIEEKVEDPLLELNAFILSGTEFDDLLNVSGKTDREALDERHVLFLSEGGDRYLAKLVQKMMESA